MKKVAYYTLGCKLNFSETSTMGRMFAERGYERVNFDEKADVYIINTCSVTDTADKKCRSIINKAIKTAPDAKIIVNGCYAQLKGNEIAQIQGVNLVLGAENKFDFFDFLEKSELESQKESENKNQNKNTPSELHSCEINQVKKFHSAYSLNDRTRSFLKIQDGCNYPCTYCTIPLARGKSRSNTIAGTVAEARKIAENGFKEIVLTGVNIGDFGFGTDENLFELIKELEKIEGIERFRISSIEPNLLTDEMIEFVSRSEKIMPHFHIPLQSGSDKILKLMKRRYNTKFFSNKITQINRFLPHAFIGIDVIVGFPSETEADFEETYQFLKNLNISFLHVFSYSVRKNTPAAEMENKILPKEIKRRSDLLHQLSDFKHTEFNKRFEGQTAKVLFEQQKTKGKMHGFTENYLKVETDFDKKLINQIIEIKLNTYEESNFKISFL